MLSKRQDHARFITAWRRKRRASASGADVLPNFRKAKFETILRQLGDPHHLGLKITKLLGAAQLTVEAAAARLRPAGRAGSFSGI
jgi:hypothetical protein